MNKTSLNYILNYIHIINSLSLKVFVITKNIIAFLILALEGFPKYTTNTPFAYRRSVTVANNVLQTQ